MPKERMRVGINSSALGKFGYLRDTFDFVELSIAELRPEEWENAVKAFKGVDLTIHAPYQNSPIKSTRIDLANNVGIKVVEKVLKFAEKVNGEAVVFHCGDYSSSKCIENVIRNLRNLEKISDVEIVVENLYTDECGITRVGETPEEMLKIVENCRSVSINLDVGHAYIASLQYRINLVDYFKVLNGYVRHMHVHNNFGTWTVPYDEHNPIFRGLIDYGELRRYIKCRRVVLEVKRGNREELVQSVSFLKSL